MRVPTLIIYLLLCVASTYAKDVITKIDGSTIDAKVEEITESVIKYRKAANPIGPVYTIPITSVMTILYENGDKDTFNESVITLTDSINQSTPITDEELIYLYNSQNFNSDKEDISDNQLIQMLYKKTPYEELNNKAKKFRLIGWIGGATIFSLFTLRGILTNHQNQFDSDGGDSNALIKGISIGAAAGAAFTIGFNLKANSMMKQAKQMELYSTPIIKGEMILSGNKSLTAGINVIGNRITRSHKLGLSLDFNF